MADYEVETLDGLFELSQAQAGETAYVEEEDNTYMRNETGDSFSFTGWQIPVVPLDTADELFAAGDPVPGVNVNGSLGTPSNTADPQQGPVNNPAAKDIFQFFRDRPGDVVYITVDGEDYPVAHLEMIATHNAIPYFVVVIDGKPLSGANSAKTSIRQPDLAELQEVRAKLSQFIYDYDKPVAFKLQEGNIDGITQTVDIKEWIISGVGSTPMQASGGYAVSVTVSHPLIMADVTHTNLFNSKELKEPAKIDKGAGNIVKKVVATLEKYLDIVGTSNLNVEGIEKEDWKKLKGRVKRAVAVLDDKLEWNNKGGSDLPFFEGSGLKLSSKLSKYFDAAIWFEVFKSSEGNHSPLNTIKAFTQGLYGVGMDGGFNDKKMLLSPEIPWGLATAVIYDDEIAQISLPAIDDLPIAGLVLPYPSKNSAGGYHFYARGKDGENSKRKDTCAFYIKPALQGQVGAIPYESLPAWLLSYPEFVAQDYGSWNPAERPNYMFNAGNSTGVKGTIRADFEKAAEQWALNRFREYLGAAKTVNISTKLNIGTEWSSIYTGDNVEVRSRQTDKPLFYFNVKAIKHIVSPSSSRASTEYYGTHVRPPEGYPSASITPNDVTNGIKNLLYDAVAKFNVSGD
jgi:hypothetical protein